LNLTKFLILTLFSFNSFALTLEEERKYDELEGLAFIKALIADKKYGEVIAQYPAISKSKNELSELTYFLAESYFELKDYSRAYSTLEKGSKFLRTNKYSSLWGRTAAKLKNYQMCSEQFRLISLTQMQSLDWPVYFQCLLKSKNESEALKIALNEKIEDPEFFLMSQKTLKKFGLESIARKIRKNYLNKCRKSEFYLSLWDVTSDSDVLETGHACLPEAMEITAAFVKVLFSEGKYHTVAYLFEQLSHDDKTYLKHVAEFYKVAGRMVVSDYFFTLGTDDDFIMAKSASYLNNENYAGLLTVPFKSSFTLKNPDLNYALAYSHFKFLSLDSALAAIQRSKRSQKDNQLEVLVAQCRDLDWRCRP